VHSISQKLNLRHLCELLGGTEGLLKTVGFKKTTEWMWWWTSPNARWQWPTVCRAGCKTLLTHSFIHSSV